MKDEEGIMIFNVTTTAATNTAKVMDTIDTSYKIYKQLKSFNDFISGINENVDKQTKETKTLYNQTFDNLCLYIDNRTQRKIGL